MDEGLTTIELDRERGQRILDLRLARKRTQRALAHELGVSEKSVYDWEQGKPISWENLMRLAALYSVDPYALHDGQAREDGVEDAERRRLGRAEADAASARASSALVLDEIRSLRADLQRVVTALEQVLDDVRALRQEERARDARGTTARRRPSTGAGEK